MRGPRFRIRSLMILVAGSALAFAALGWLASLGMYPPEVLMMLVGGLFPVGIFAIGILLMGHSH